MRRATHRVEGGGRLVEQDALGSSVSARAIAARLRVPVAQLGGVGVRELIQVHLTQAARGRVFGARLRVAVALRSWAARTFSSSVSSEQRRVLEHHRRSASGIGTRVLGQIVDALAVEQESRRRRVATNRRC